MPGLDEIALEMLKAGGDVMVEHLMALLNVCWRLKQVPDEWQKGVHCCITLLSVPGKLFCASLLRRLRVALDKRLREEQAGFHAGRSCCNQIFTLRNIIEQGVKYNFVDFTKAFNSIHRNSLWHILRLYGVPEPFVTLFKDIYIYFFDCHTALRPNQAEQIFWHQDRCPTRMSSVPHAVSRSDGIHGEKVN